MAGDLLLTLRFKKNYNKKRKGAVKTAPAFCFLLEVIVVFVFGLVVVFVLRRITVLFVVEKIVIAWLVILIVILVVIILRHNTLHSASVKQ